VTNAIQALLDRFFLVASIRLHRAEQETATFSINLRPCWMKRSISLPDGSGGKEKGAEKVAALLEHVHLIARTCLHRAEQETPTMGLSLRLTWMRCSISRPNRSA